MYNLTYLGHRVTLPWLDPRSNFDLDLSRSNDTWFDAPWRDKHDGIKISVCSRIEVIRSKLSNFSAHVSGVSAPPTCCAAVGGGWVGVGPGRRLGQCWQRCRWQRGEAPQRRWSAVVTHAATLLRNGEARWSVKVNWRYGAGVIGAGMMRNELSWASCGDITSNRTSNCVEISVWK